MSRTWALCLLLGLAACGDDDDAGGLEAYLPELPPPTGEPQAAFAGTITAANQLLTGPAATGVVGDFFLRNDVASFVVSAPGRLIAVVPTGGNLIDAAPLDSAGAQAAGDHFGELSLLYLFGRTCDHTEVEVLRDGSGGGVAALQARGRSTNNDFINIKGLGLLPVNPVVDPVFDDGAECATTYVLEPGSTRLRTYFSLYNGGEIAITGPYGTLSDTGGEIEAWGNGRGFERAGLTDITALAEPAPIDYVVYQGPDVAYGLAARFDQPTSNTAALIAGVSVYLLGTDNLLGILDEENYFLEVPKGGGHLQELEVVVGRDAGDVDAAYRASRGLATTPISGQVSWSAGGAALGARVAVFADLDGNGAVGPDDPIVSYLDVDAEGRFAGVVPAVGNHLLRAEVRDVGRSATVAAGADLAFTIPSPIRVDFSIVDDATNMPMPGRLLVVGEHPVPPDARVFPTYDRLGGVITQLHAIRGTSTDIGDGADPALLLPSGGSYRVFASHGTEYAVASVAVSGASDVDIELRLRNVAPTAGYLATDWHVHQIDSPDSPVPSDERLRSAVSAGVDLFAVTDHDFIADLQPLVVSLGLEERVHVLSGLEMTPFAYGHFQAWPLVPDPASPNRGAIDWAQGRMGGDCVAYGPWCAMTPAEILEAARDRGAQMLQINHPRASGLAEFQSYFDRAALRYDYDARTIFGDFEGGGVDYEALRLPGESLWTDAWNGLEVWNAFGMDDTDDDGRDEIVNLDRVLRDYFNMLSLGFVVSPAANSDSHTSVADPVGMPRTLIRVPDDSGAALASGEAAEQVLRVTTGATTRDIVLTNGPMLALRVDGLPAIGQTVSATGAVTFVLDVTSPAWAHVDTIEVFANDTPESPAEVTSLTPLKCWTTRNLATLDPSDPCARAPLAAESLTVSAGDVAGFPRWEATLTASLDAADVAAATRAGATGTDAWFVFRARGDRAIFPLLTGNTIDASTLPVILTGDLDAISAALEGRGVSAAAMTAPVFVDFDGGGYLAPFAP